MTFGVKKFHQDLFKYMVTSVYMLLVITVAVRISVIPTSPF